MPAAQPATPAKFRASHPASFQRAGEKVQPDHMHRMRLPICGRRIGMRMRRLQQRRSLPPHDYEAEGARWGAAHGYTEHNIHHTDIARRRPPNYEFRIQYELVVFYKQPASLHSRLPRALPAGAAL